VVQGKFFGSFHFAAPVDTSSCGTFFWFRYLCTAELVGVPMEFTSARTWSSSISLRVCSTVLGGL
jgi:hypothetical protein